MLDLTVPMIKHAGEVEQGGMVDLQNGQSVNVHHLSKEALEAVDDGLAVMPKRKLAKVLPTLLAPDADVLCKAAGVVKVAKPIMERPGLPEQKPSKGTKAIGKPASNEELAKGAQAMPPGSWRRSHARPWRYPRCSGPWCCPHARRCRRC